MDGMEVFAKDDDICYLYTHPTDVRFVRENYDDVEKDQQEWTKINEWAGQEVRQEIRFDFFKSQDGQNLIREVKTIDGEEITTLYQANRKDADDAGETTTSIVEAWCKSIAAGAEVDED